MKRDESTRLTQILSHERALETFEHVVLALALGLALVTTLQVLS